MEDVSQQCPFVVFTSELMAKPNLNRPIYQLQHHSGFNINLIFYLVWVAKMRLGRLTKRQLKALENHIMVWHQRILAELKYTHALIANHDDPFAIEMRQTLQAEILRAHRIEQQLLFETQTKRQKLRRSPEQQFLDACASLTNYCELKNDVIIPEDRIAFGLLFSAAFHDVEKAIIERQVAILSDRFQLISHSQLQQVLWD